MKAAVPLFAALAVIASGCGDSGQREKAAIKAVFDTQQGQTLSRQFPATPKSVQCVIRGALNIREPGTCTTLVSINPDGSAVVLFRESWVGFDFVTYGQSCPANSCAGADHRRRMHTWDFTLTKDGQIEVFDTYGALPPQWVR